MPEPLRVLSGGFRGGEVRHYAEISSTMDLARAGDLPWNATVVATSQTSGRGRYDRRWSSPDAGGLYLTTWIRHDRTPEGAANLSQGTALALALLCQKLEISGIRLKWPNDLLLSGRKAAGILAECFSGKDGLGIAVGVGLNVAVPQEVLDTVGQPATNLSRELGQDLSLDEVLRDFLHLWSQVDVRLQQGGFAAIAEDYRSFSDLPGRVFRLSTGMGEERVRVLAIADNGSLLVEPEAGGEPRSVWGGELLK